MTKREERVRLQKVVNLLSIVSDDNCRNKEQSMVSRRNFPPIYMKTQQHTSYVNLISYISYFAEHNIWWKGGRRQSITDTTSCCQRRKAYKHCFDITVHIVSECTAVWRRNSSNILFLLFRFNMQTRRTFLFVCCMHVHSI